MIRFFDQVKERSWSAPGGFSASWAIGGGIAVGMVVAACHGERSRLQALFKVWKNLHRKSRATGAALADEGAKGVMLVCSPPHQPHKKEKNSYLVTIQVSRYCNSSFHIVAVRFWLLDFQFRYSGH